MAVTVRQYRRGKGFEVDVRFDWPDGTSYRRRIKAPTATRAQAVRWGEAFQREVMNKGKPALKKRKEVPTVEKFFPRFMEQHCRADRLKPSSIARMECSFKHHIQPELGKVPLDQVTAARIQKLKAAMAHLQPKSVNNVLSPISMMLKKAVEWKVIDEMPCHIRLLKVTLSEPAWYEPAEYDRLARAAAKCDRRIEVMVRLGGEAGLRRGEFIALKWTDVDFERGLIKVKTSIWGGHETVPKGGRGRVVPMTKTLAAVLKAHRHLRSPRVLCRDDGGELTNKVVRNWMDRAQRRANLEPTGAVHRLRHTFCSMLAMRGAPAKAIQELAGHADLSTTMRYMHLSPAARDQAIGLLDEVLSGAKSEQVRGEMLETGPR